MANLKYKTFRDIGQKERILTGASSAGYYITATPVLPDPATTKLGSVYLLTKYSAGYIPGIVYILNEVDGVRMWMDISVSQVGKLPAPTNFWKRITKSSIILHWESAKDKVDSKNKMKSATWDYDVVVRKFGSDPTSPNDGEILGYSTVRNQYNDESEGFIVDTDDDDPSFDYHYAVFSCTISNVPTRSQVLRGSWTWDEIKAIVNSGKHHQVFRVGDVIPLPAHADYGVLHAVIVDFDRTPNSTSEKRDSIVFQILEVLDHMSYDNAELMYARTTDQTFKLGCKYYFRKHDGSFEEIEPALEAPIDHPKSQPVIGESISVFRSAHIGEDYISDTYDRADIPGYPSHIKNCPIVYASHASVTRWVTNANHPYPQTQSLTMEERMLQSCVVNGDAHWRLSNMRDWLALRLTTDASNYIEDTEPIKTDADHCAEGNCNPVCIHQHTLAKWWKLPRIRIATYGSVNLSTVVTNSVNDAEVLWRQAKSDDDISWLTETNGWFEVTLDNWHNTAPGGWEGANYIGKMPFQNGFPKEFTDLIYQHRSTTITDEIFWRYIWGDSKDATKITDVRYVIAIDSEKFWLPSYEEIYGHRPTAGTNGTITTASDDKGEPYTEGSQFEYYKDHIERALKRDRNGVPRTWWLRSCDPTTLGKLFCVSNGCVAGDVPYCIRSAHQKATDEYVGPSPCFIIRAK